MTDRVPPRRYGISGRSKSRRGSLLLVLYGELAFERQVEMQKFCDRYGVHTGSLSWVANG